MKKKLLVFLFNICEFITTFLFGKLLKLPNDIILIIMLLFVLVRMTFGKPLHYKSPYRCFIMTLLVFLSMFVVFHVNLYVSILFTIFDAYLLTGKGDINEVFMWNGKTSKYQDIFDFIKYNPYNERLLKFEEALKNQDNLSYMIYKYRFKDKMTFEEISNRLDIDNPRISEIQDSIAFAFRITMQI